MQNLETFADLIRDEQIRSYRSSEMPSTPGWGNPLPLPDSLPPVAGFDAQLLPESMRTWAADISDRVQCPPDFVGVTIMAALGSLIGRQVGIRPQGQTDWTVSANQWALLIGRPGVLKSPAMEAALAPLKGLSAQAHDDYVQAMRDFKSVQLRAKLMAEEAEKKARADIRNGKVPNIALDEDDDGPVLRRYLANDTTAAALGELHRQNSNGILVFRDEMVSLLKSLDREDNSEARGFYLTGWNGDSPYTFDRIARGLNLHIPAVCLSMLGSTQPGRIAEYVSAAVRGGAGDDGLIQRFALMVWPDVSGDWRNVDRWPDSAAKQKAFLQFSHLSRVPISQVGARQDEGIDGQSEGMPYLRFAPDALELFVDWRSDLERRLRTGDLHPAMESHLAKYRKLVPGIALICHLADGAHGDVAFAALAKAIGWGAYLESHAKRVYASVNNPEVTAARAILARVRKGDLPKSFASWQVWRPGWATLSDREQVTRALQLLMDFGWVTRTVTPTGGRQATTYDVNPRGLQ